MLKVQLFLSFLFVGFTTVSWSQYTSHDDLFENFEFRKFIEIKENNAAGQKEYLQLAQAHYYLNEFELANNYFEKLNWQDEELDFETHLYYANSLKNTGEIFKAKLEVNTYLNEFPKDSQALLLLMQIENYSSLSKRKKSKIILTNSSQLNSSTAQFAPVFKGQELYFVSELKTPTKNSLNVDFNDKNPTELSYGLNVRPQSVLQLAGADLESTQLFKSFEKFNIGASCYNLIENEWLLTLTPQAKKWQQLNQTAPRIYSWKEGSDSPKKLKLKGVKAAIGCGHPAISSDGKFLVFSIDNGKNGSDLYLSKKEDKNWSKPQKLSNKINTIKDEVFPVFEGDSILYFSSDGHLGFGGLDIYKARFNQGNFEGEIKLLNRPFNTESDDYSLIFSNETKTQGFLTSDRVGGNGDADIYFFDTQIPWKFELIVKKEDGQLVSNLTLKLKINGVDKEIKINSNNQYEKLELKAGSVISLTLNANDSTFFRELTLPSGNGKDTLLAIVIPDKKQVIQEVLATNQIEMQSIESVLNSKIESVYFDFNKFNVSKSQTNNLDELVSVLKRFPQKIVIVKTFSDERGDILYNLELTTKRAKEIFKFLVKNDIDPNQIKLQSLGEAIYDEKCSPNCDESIHSKYRRADFEIR